MPRRSKHSRSFTGCGTCRKRHTKCDEARPICGNCHRLNIHCKGYTRGLSWVQNEEGNDDGESSGKASTQYRHLLFTEEERRLMSDEITASTNGSNADDLLRQLEQHCESSDRLNNVPTLFLGPFSVFSAAPSPGEPTLSFVGPDLVPEDPYLSLESGNEGVEEVLRLADNERTSDTGLFTIPYHGLQLPDDVFEQIDPEGLSISHSSAFSGFLDPSLENLGTELSLDPGDGYEPQSSLEHCSDVNQSSDLRDWMPGNLSLMPSVGNNLISDDIAYLLSISRQNIRLVNGPKTIPKASWQSLAVPTAMETFAELILSQLSSHTRLATFYSVLANNAFHLSRTDSDLSQGLHWRSTGVKYFETAKSHLQGALSSEMLNGQSSHYRELLLAFLAMIMISSYHQPRDMPAYLMDAERLIRMQGIPNPKKSFKMRTLHHVYTHLRILVESMSVYKEIADEDASSPPLLQAAGSSWSNLRRFKVSEESLNTGLDPSQQKALFLGYNDIHLEVQGRWSETLYPQMYGIPESLMTLLSQTISLANDKKRLDRIASSDSQVYSALNRHIKTLENNIWTWQPSQHNGPPRPAHMTAGPDDQILGSLSRNTALAVHQAVSIYFYRRIYNVHAMMLQHFVHKCLNHLLPCLVESSGDADFATSLGWACFIAACEAATSTVQDLALQCLASIDHCGLICDPDTAMRVAREVWEKRKSTQDFTFSWTDVLTLDS